MTFCISRYARLLRAVLIEQFFFSGLPLFFPQENQEIYPNFVNISGTLRILIHGKKREKVELDKNPGKSMYGILGKHSFDKNGPNTKVFCYAVPILVRDTRPLALRKKGYPPHNPP